MRLRDRRQFSKPEVMIIPMIDIIFFLLVFFMMSTLSMTDQQVIPVQLPRAASAQQEIVRSAKVPVARDGGLYLGQEEVSLPELKERLEQAAAQGEVAISLRADEAVDYGRVLRVLDELKTTGAARISLAAKR